MEARIFSKTILLQYEVSRAFGVPEARLEPSLAAAGPGERFQFERLGYFCVDTRESAPGAPVFNRTVALRDTWAKLQNG